MPDKLLVALGGNALVRQGQSGSIVEQAANLERCLSGIIDLVVSGVRVVLTHGNGPQVGYILLRSEMSREQAYELPLDVCVAQSQGEIGYLIQRELENLLHRRRCERDVVVVVTRTLVDEDDPRMQQSTKPVGPFYDKARARALEAQGYTMVEEPQRGYRHVVPSPLPVGIMETEEIKHLFDAGVIVIAAGGGGIPVCVREDENMEGVEAVVDKDYTAGMLAGALGVERILDLTSVGHAKLHFGSSREQELTTLTASEAKEYLAEGHFAPGSMGPKVEAAVSFLTGGGQEVIIAHADEARSALAGEAGTHIYPD